MFILRHLQNLLGLRHKINSTLLSLLLTLVVLVPSWAFGLLHQGSFFWPYFIYLFLCVALLPLREAGICTTLFLLFTYWLFRVYYHVPALGLLLGEGVSVIIMVPLFYMRWMLQQKNTENMVLTQKELELLGILNSLPLAVILSDDGGYITYVNQTASALLGYTKEEFLALEIRDLVPKDLQERHGYLRLGFYQHPQFKQMAITKNVRAVTKTGEEIPADIFLGFLHRMKHLQVISIIIDIRERKKLEEERLRIESLNEALRIRDRFLSVAAHELKTPLATVSIYADILEEEHKDALKDIPSVDEQHQAIRDQSLVAITTIQKQIAVMGKLINQFLDISYIHNGNLSMLVKERVDMEVYLKNIQTLTQLQTGKHKILLDCPPKLLAYLDTLRIEQVIFNLLNNAIKYSPEGGDVTLKAWENEDGFCVITVQDHGLGIPEANRPFIFQKFYQVHADTNRSGLGLGLYLSREIILQHGGTISFECPEEGGTIFQIKLPPKLDKNGLPKP